MRLLYGLDRWADRQMIGEDYGVTKCFCNIVAAMLKRCNQRWPCDLIICLCGQDRSMAGYCDKFTEQLFVYRGILVCHILLSAVY